jgi:O-antigen biosynthesis protein WbqP
MKEKRQWYLKYIKRSVDLGFSLLGLLFAWPVFLLIALLIKVDSKGPVFFKQKRIGEGKREFYIYKYRTMRIDTPKDTPTHLLSKPDLYITRVGRFLRKTSLDEIPQIFNIIRGEMSIVGPRPALWNQYDLIAERDKYGVNELAPGLTGWAQVNGRDELPIPVKAEYDGLYVKRVGFWLDVRIFWMTVWSVVASRGVVEGGTGKLKHYSVVTTQVENSSDVTKETI